MAQNSGHRLACYVLEISDKCIVMEEKHLFYCCDTLIILSPE